MNFRVSNIPTPPIATQPELGGVRMHALVRASERRHHHSRGLWEGGGCAMCVRTVGPVPGPRVVLMSWRVFLHS